MARINIYKRNGMSVCVLESVWEPPAEGFLSVAEQEAEKNNKKTRDKEKTASKKKAPSAGSTKFKRKKTEKEGGGGDDDDDDDNDGGEETIEKGPSTLPARGEFEPFMMETTRIGSWKTVETT